MYKYANKEHTKVNNLTTGECGIGPDSWMWGAYQGWLLKGHATEPFDLRTAADIAADEINAQKAAIAAQRYAMETGGITYQGMLFPTDRESVQILDSTCEKIRRGLIAEVPWKCTNGYIILHAGNITDIEIAILTHVQTAFAWEKAQVEALV